MRNIILATAVVFTLSGTAQANVIIEHVSKIKMDVEQGLQDGKDQLQRNKEELNGLFLKIKGFVISAKDKLDELNNAQ